MYYGDLCVVELHETHHLFGFEAIKAIKPSYCLLKFTSDFISRTFLCENFAMTSVCAVFLYGCPSC